MFTAHIDFYKSTWLENKTQYKINLKITGRVTGQAYSILEMASSLKEQEERDGGGEGESKTEIVARSWIQAVPTYPEGPHSLSLGRVTP